VTKTCGFADFRTEAERARSDENTIHNARGEQRLYRTFAAGQAECVSMTQWLRIRFVCPPTSEVRESANRTRAGRVNTGSRTLVPVQPTLDYGYE
jgi:hypothetical protein